MHVTFTHALIVTDGDTTTQFLPWPVMLACRRHGAHGPWLACTPEFVIPPVTDAAAPAARGGGDSGDIDAALRAVAAYCDRIPARVRRVVAEFPERQWEVLTWTARTGAPAEDLLVSNPALAFALALDAPRPRGRRGAAVRTEVRYLLPLRRQARVLERLGFPGTERVRKILRRIAPRAMTVRRLDRLRRWLADETVADMCVRLPAIDLSVMALFDRGQIARTPFDRLLHLARADQAHSEDTAVRMYAEAIRVWTSRPVGTAQPSGQTESRQRRPAHTPAEFPPPPLPGTETIVPILTRADLREEGRVQRNCVDRLASQAIRRERAFYRVLYPERSTLSLKPTPHGWAIDELVAAANRPVLPATSRAVMEWLARCRDLGAWC